MISRLANLIPGRVEKQECIKKIKEKLIVGEFIILDQDLVRKYCTNIKINDAINKLAIELDKKLNVDLGWAKDLRDTSMLGEVHTLCISGNSLVTDVDNLGSVHTLVAAGCHNIKNVNNLGKVHTLDICNCDNITDVSMLGEVHKLNLENCARVTDISMLGNVHELTIGGMREGITNLDNLGSGSMNKLCLKFSTRITDLSPLAFGSLNVISFFRCASIVDISPICNVGTVTLEYCDNIVNIGVLKNTKKLFLIGCKKIKDMSGIYRVEKLALIDLPHILNIGNLRGLKSLMITSKKFGDNNHNKVYGLFLLFYLEKLILSVNVKTKMAREIRKLKKINKDFDITNIVEI
jgi:hypothetical protein